MMTLSSVVKSRQEYWFKSRPMVSGVMIICKVKCQSQRVDVNILDNDSTGGEYRVCIQHFASQPRLITIPGLFRLGNNPKQFTEVFSRRYVAG